MLHFLSPYRLLGGSCIIITHFLVHKKYPLVLPFLSSKGVSAKKVSYILTPYRPEYILIVLLSILSAQPVLLPKLSAYQYVIALDVSPSMYANDLLPYRLAVAQSSLSTMLQRYDNNSYGVALFAGTTYISAQVSPDAATMEKIITTYTPDEVHKQSSISNGTALGDAIQVSLSLFDQQEPYKQRKIILITDGTNNKGSDPLDSAKRAYSSGVSIYTIALGTTLGGYIPVESAFGTHQKKVEAVDTTTLEKVAKISGGRAFLATTKGELDAALESILSTH